MKKLIFTQFFIVLCISGLSAQLKVDHRGHVCTAYDVIVEAPNVYIGPKDIPENRTDGRGEWGIELLSGGLNFWRPFGNTDWGNYFLYIKKNGVGIGKVPSYKLDVNGDIATYGVLQIVSDMRLRTEIQSLSKEQNKIYDLEAKSYKKFSPEIDDYELNRLKGIPEAEIKNRKIVKEECFEYGFLAQELMKVYPELVTQDNDGYYAINYIGLIPLIIEALKEQKEEINLLKSTESIAIKKNTVSDIANEIVFEKSTSNNKAAVLYQNIPNPFNQSTQIKYYLPETVITAYLCFYNLQGNQLKQITLTERGESSQIISGSQFSPGIYLYALIADGQEVDVKRMILTE